VPESRNVARLTLVGDDLNVITCRRRTG
jgi:hypothetical protein